MYGALKVKMKLKYNLLVSGGANVFVGTGIYEL